MLLMVMLFDIDYHLSLLLLVYYFFVDVLVYLKRFVLVDMLNAVFD